MTVDRPAFASASSGASAVLPDTNPKTAVGAKKPRLSAIPPVALIHLGQAMDDGRRKYGLMNWRLHGISASVYYDAIQRHLQAWWDGENAAGDSGINHLAHVMACCSIVLDAIELAQLNDDRPPPGAAPALIARLTPSVSSYANFREILSCDGNISVDAYGGDGLFQPGDE